MIVPTRTGPDYETGSNDHEITVPQLGRQADGLPVDAEQDLFEPLSLDEVLDRGTGRNLELLQAPGAASGQKNLDCLPPRASEAGREAIFRFLRRTSFPAFISPLCVIVYLF